MLDNYRQHVAERAALGIPPLPLTAKQTAELIELLKNPPAGEEQNLVELLTHRVPAGVDDAAKVKASYLAAVALGTADDETARAVAAWLLREPPLAEDPALRHAHGAVWAALTAARGTPRDADAIADDLPAIGDTIANVLRQTLRIATALPVAA